MDQRISISGFHKTQTYAMWKKKVGKKKGTEECIQTRYHLHQGECIHFYVYLHIEQLLKTQETSNLTLGQKMREEKDGIGRKLTFHRTPHCTVLFFYMYVLLPSKIIFKRQLASIPDFFIYYMCDLVQSLTSTFSSLK